MSDIKPRTIESLEQLIRRVTLDAANVGCPVTPRTLALAIATGGWHHDRAPVVTGGPKPTRRKQLVTTEGNQ